MPKTEKQVKTYPVQAPKTSLRNGSIRPQITGSISPQIHTPTTVARQMVEMAGLTVDVLESNPDLRVLEPGAGAAHIADEIRDAGFEPDVCEISSTLREILEAKQYNIIRHDFLELQEKLYDVIVMNPPFGNGADIDHVRHAFSLLADKGVLVSVVGEGAFYRSDSKASAFRLWLEHISAETEKLPEGTFMDPELPVTTGANARVVVIRKSALIET